MVLPPAVRGCRTEQQVDAVPPEGKGGGEEDEGGRQAAEEVEVLHWVHAQTGERFYVCVAVVQAVDVFVERGDVDKPGIIYSALYILHHSNCCIIWLSERLYHRP